MNNLIILGFLGFRCGFKQIKIFPDFSKKVSTFMSETLVTSLAAEKLNNLPRFLAAKTHMRIIQFLNLSMRKLHGGKMREELSEIK